MIPSIEACTQPTTTITTTVPHHDHQYHHTHQQHLALTRNFSNNNPLPDHQHKYEPSITSPSSALQSDVLQPGALSPAMQRSQVPPGNNLPNSPIMLQHNPHLGSPYRLPGNIPGGGPSRGPAGIRSQYFVSPRMLGETVLSGSVVSPIVNTHRPVVPPYVLMPLTSQQHQFPRSPSSLMTASHHQLRTRHHYHSPQHHFHHLQQHPMHRTHLQMKQTQSSSHVKHSNSLSNSNPSSMGIKSQTTSKHSDIQSPPQVKILDPNKHQAPPNIPKQISMGAGKYSGTKHELESLLLMQNRDIVSNKLNLSTAKSKQQPQPNQSSSSPKSSASKRQQLPIPKNLPTPKQHDALPGSNQPATSALDKNKLPYVKFNQSPKVVPKSCVESPTPRRELLRSKSGDQYLLRSGHPSVSHTGSKPKEVLSKTSKMFVSKSSSDSQSKLVTVASSQPIAIIKNTRHSATGDEFKSIWKESEFFSPKRNIPSNRLGKSVENLDEYLIDGLESQLDKISLSCSPPEWKSNKNRSKISTVESCNSNVRKRYSYGDDLQSSELEFNNIQTSNLLFSRQLDKNGKLPVSRNVKANTRKNSHDATAIVDHSIVDDFISSVKLEESLNKPKNTKTTYLRTKSDTDFRSSHSIAQFCIHGKSKNCGKCGNTTATAKSSKKMDQLDDNYPSLPVDRHAFQSDAENQPHSIDDLQMSPKSPSKKVSIPSWDLVNKRHDRVVDSKLLHLKHKRRSLGNVFQLNLENELSSDSYGLKDDTYVDKEPSVLWKKGLVKSISASIEGLVSGETEMIKTKSRVISGEEDSNKFDGNVVSIRNMYLSGNNIDTSISGACELKIQDDPVVTYHQLGIVTPLTKVTSVAMTSNSMEVEMLTPLVLMSEKKQILTANDSSQHASIIESIPAAHSGHLQLTSFKNSCSVWQSNSSLPKSCNQENQNSNNISASVNITDNSNNSKRLSINTGSDSRCISLNTHPAQSESSNPMLLSKAQVLVINHDDDIGSRTHNLHFSKTNRMIGVNDDISVSSSHTSLQISTSLSNTNNLCKNVGTALVGPENIQDGSSVAQQSTSPKPTKPKPSQSTTESKNALSSSREEPSCASLPSPSTSTFSHQPSCIASANPGPSRKSTLLKQPHQYPRSKRRPGIKSCVINLLWFQDHLIVYFLYTQKKLLSRKILFMVST